MTNICPNAGCDALYDVTNDDLGRTFPCRKCGAMLLVEEGGLRVLSRQAERVPTAEALPHEAERAPANPPPHRPTSQSRPAHSRSENHPMRPLMQPGAVTGVLFNVLYGVGAGLVVLFALLPVTDSTRVASRQAAIEAGQLRFDRKYDLDSSSRDPIAFPPGGPDKDKPTSGPSDSERKVWEKEKKNMQADVDDAKVWSHGALAFYSWGLLFGFLCLSAASVGLLGANQPTTRRVLGIITLSGIVLFILVFTTVYFVGMSYR
jgi:hypothetical protein